MKNVAFSLASVLPSPTEQPFGGRNYGLDGSVEIRKDEDSATMGITEGTGLALEIIGCTPGRRSAAGSGNVVAFGLWK